MDTCLFCDLVAGKIPCDEVFSDERSLAFRDINPQGPVHILLIPKRHIGAMTELGDEDTELVGSMLVTAARIAQAEGLAEQGYRCVINCGRHGCQSVDHLHIHLIGGRQMGWPPG